MATRAAASMPRGCTVLDYRDALLDAGVATDAIVAEGVGHGWIDAAPQAIVEWFDRHGGA